jgi:hypothetical protein
MEASTGSNATAFQIASDHGRFVAAYAATRPADGVARAIPISDVKCGQATELLVCEIIERTH